jgi:hypothetical protein
VAALRSTNLFVYLLIAVCLILLAPYFGVHLLVTEAPQPLDSERGDASPRTEFSTSNGEDLKGVKPSKALSDIEDLLER